jgi:cytochrome c biogenesis protein CcmG/thiol:disulfide interchange protein DsbE
MMPALALAVALAAPPTPEALAARSWDARKALAARSFDDADRIAEEVRAQCLQLLKTRKLEADKQLPTALGASIEVHAQVLAERGQRVEAVDFLKEQMALYGRTTLRIRIQKNLHMLSLEGKPAPPLEGVDWAKLRGRPALVLFWAHWCGPCKTQAAIIARIAKQHEDLALVGPTQLYGYTVRGTEAGPEEEKRYIADVRAKSYAGLEKMTAPLGAENFRVYGASTTPTVVLVDRSGIVRLYHSGNISYEDLAPRVEAVMAAH